MFIEKTEGPNRKGKFSEMKEMTQMEKVSWPFSIRFFHWSLVLLVFLTFVTSLGDQWLKVHMVFGFLAFVCALWRLFYGFSGPFHTQFKNFIVSPKKVFIYLKKVLSFDPPLVAGHNPPHGWMILGIIAVLIVEFLLGLVVFWGDENGGLYSAFVVFSSGEMVKEVHEGVGVLFLSMIVVHLCGVAVDSYFHGRNIVKGMIFAKEIQYGSIAKSASFRLSLSLNALFVVVLVLGSTVFFQTVYAKRTAVDLSLGGNGWELWKEECAGCHELFHPSLLPEQLWTNMMGGLTSHFGDDASLDKEDEILISDFLVTFSAERSDTEAAYKISKSIKGIEGVLRITESPYWIKKHKHIERNVFKRKKIRSKTACSACHLDALSGGYEDNRIEIPNTY